MPSPNFNDRRGRAIDALILHYTGMATGEAALARLRDPAAEVSCHYVVGEDGAVDQLVAERDRAWHAGRSSWAGESDLNSVSIGIEIVNGGHDFGCPPYPEAQVAAVIALCREIALRRAIAPARVLAHSDVAPDRKKDPGEHFPWRALAEAGVGIWPAPCPAPAGEPQAGVARADDGRADDDRHDVLALQRDLAAIGYRCGVDGQLDATTGEAIAALQRHWRPDAVTGCPDAATRAIARALAPLART